LMTRTLPLSADVAMFVIASAFGIFLFIWNLFYPWAVDIFGSNVPSWG
jgi:hypothetical protein